MSTALASMRERHANLTNALEGARERIAQVIPVSTGLVPSRVIAVVLDSLTRDPYVLGNCTPASIVRSVIQASEIGLELGSVLGEAYLVPFKGQATMMVGYKGYVRLIRQSPRVTILKSVLVREADTFEIDEGENRLVHKLATGTGRQRGKITHAYSRVYYTDGTSQFEVMDIDELDKIKNAALSLAKGRHTPWSTNVEEMYKKCPIRRQAKILELSPIGRRAKEIDDLESMRRGEFGVLRDRDGFDTGRVSELKEMLRAQASKVTAVDAEFEEGT